MADAECPVNVMITVDARVTKADGSKVYIGTLTNAFSETSGKTATVTMLRDVTLPDGKNIAIYSGNIIFEGGEIFGEGSRGISLIGGTAKISGGKSSCVSISEQHSGNVEISGGEFLGNGATLINSSKNIGTLKISGGTYHAGVLSSPTLLTDLLTAGYCFRDIEGNIINLEKEQNMLMQDSSVSKADFSSETVITLAGENSPVYDGTPKTPELVVKVGGRTTDTGYGI